MKAILQISEVVFYFKGFVMIFVKLFKLLENKHLTHTAVDGDKQVKRYYCSYSSFVSPILIFIDEMFHRQIKGLMRGLW